MKSIDTKAPIEELVTLRDMIRWAMSQFNEANLYYGHGMDNSWDEAVFLCLHAIHLPPNADHRILEAKLLMKEREQIVDLIRKRIEERKPAAYLTNTAWFAGLSFYVDERVIVPRSPIAELIERGFDPWLDREKVFRVLDLCTGSGCFAVTCALAFPNAKIDAVDISADVLEVAQINVANHGVEEAIRLIQSDLFSELEESKYDLIVTNPPYVATPEMQALPTEFRHEPELALAAGEAGLDIVERILKDALQYLSPHGVLVCEVGNSAAALEQHFPEIPFLWLEFERGGHGVFLLTAEQLGEYFLSILSQFLKQGADPMSVKPEDLLQDGVNELAIHAVHARKGTVAAALANANIINSIHTNEEEKAEARHAIKKLTPALVALEMHKHLAWKNPEIQKIIDDFLILNSVPIE